jgi:hypothetical protein
MHSIGFTTIFLSFGVALLLANIVLRDFGGSWRRFAWYSIATAIFPIIAALGNLSTIGAIASGFETTHGAGLITEVLVVVALAWYIILSYRVLRQGRKG